MALALPRSFGTFGETSGFLNVKTEVLLISGSAPMPCQSADVAHLEEPEPLRKMVR